MPSCVLRYCNNNTRNTAKWKGITFHRFPREDREEREKWIKFIQKNRSEETWLPSNFTNVCSLHFREEDKYTTKTGRRFLKKSAVPCIEDPRTYHGTGKIEPNIDSDSDCSILDTPKQIVLKRKLQKITNAKIKLTNKIKKVQRENRNLKKKCVFLIRLTKSLKAKLNNRVIITQSSY